MTGLCAGWAREDITPPAGIHMGGYWGRRSGAAGIHDPLYASVILWRAGGREAEGAALVALDLVGVTPELTARIREQVVSAADPAVSIRPEAVTVCCSHTHAGPLTMPFRGMGDVDGAYLERVCGRVARSAGRAAEGLGPVRIRYARPAARIAVNRRQSREGQVVIGEDPAGPVAAHAHVIVFEAVRPGGRRAVLFQHACHPVVLGSSNHEISADFPGPARRVVEERTGALAVFVNGAAGDINPRRFGGSFAEVESLGAELGAAVADAVSAAGDLAGGGIAWSRERLDLPLIPPSPAMAEEVRRSIGELEAAASLAGDDPWQRRVPEAQLAWAREWLAEAGREDAADTQAFEVHGLRIGPLVLLGMEGEIFVRYQLDLERECQAPLVLCGYANGCIGYVPTAGEYARGGYEIDQAYKIYPSVRMIAPESEGIVRAGAWRVLEGLGVRRR